MAFLPLLPSIEVVAGQMVASFRVFSRKEIISDVSFAIGLDNEVYLFYHKRKTFVLAPGTSLILWTPL